jgi:hypothetical protein
LLEKPSILEAGGSSTIFPVRIELPFAKNTAYLSGFSRSGNINIVQHSSIQVTGRSSVSVVRKSSMLDTGECSILFHVRFELTFEINNAYFKM